MTATADVVVVGRSQTRSAELADALNAHANVSSATPVRVSSQDDLKGDDIDVFVNCTPVGMQHGPDPDGSPLPEHVALTDRHTVFDTVFDTVTNTADSD